MKCKALLFIAIATIFMNFKSTAIDLRAAKERNFNTETDLLLVQFDCKTDADDIHTIAALKTLLSDPSFSKVKYHAVAGTYGIQGGLYIPANDLFELAFEENWTDAHENVPDAVEKVKVIVETTLTNKGDIWIAEAGQSDFTAGLIKAIQLDLPEINVLKRIHVVQHSDWNEKSTSTENLQFVKENSDYHKIPDGNVVRNGTPGFRDPEYTNWKDKIKNQKLLEVWQLATDIANRYNGVEGRYNNKAISVGGLDFSDLVEVCWILGIQNIKDTEQFFNVYSH